MSVFFMVLLAFMVMRAVTGGGHRRHRRRERAALLEEKVGRLEGMVAELQEQADQDRVLLRRLEEERDFFRQLYPGNAGRPS